MSEQIDNRKYRKDVIKQIISELHKGKSVNEVKKQFEEAFEGVSAMEISEAEQALISEGLPITEVQRLCDVHASVFKGSIEEIHQPTDASEIPGHPANIIKRENRFIEKLVDTHIKPNLLSLINKETIKNLKHALDELAKIDIHSLRKENLLFPYMEKYGITGPPKVMWGVDDDIRSQIKQAISLISSKKFTVTELQEKVAALTEKVTEMIFKEENIMLPMLLETLTQDEWIKIADESSEIGYLIDRIPVWSPSSENEMTVEKEKTEPGIITLPSGVLRINELVGMLDTLPFDITFVDKDDIVKYFSQGTERIFPRTKAIIGRNVSNCHPPASVHIVQKIVEDFKSGKKDHEDFWINMGGKLVYIRYFAVRNKDSEYLGVLEVTQNIKPIQEITGEKRLMSE
ncbi:MAG: PAS domain S-box protein [Clostridiales bacterium GWF2_36_10]|nr:MAG: PAS domain S-box protein [Clostridiales bacterium GWF2_36_10]